MDTEPRLALVVDDEPSMRDIIVFALETQDFTTCTAGSAEAAWTVLQERQVDLVVLDVMLPGLSGVELCRRISQTSRVPVILLTALGETSQRIAGLEAGAADYVAKPFHPRELALRAASLVKRRVAADVSAVTHGPLTVNLLTTTAYVSGQRVDLTHHEFRLAAGFRHAPGRDPRVPPAAAARLGRRRPHRGQGAAEDGDLPAPHEARGRRPPHGREPSAACGAWATSWRPTTDAPARPPTRSGSGVNGHSPVTRSRRVVTVSPAVARA